MLRLFPLILCALPLSAAAQTPDPIVANTVQNHVLAGFDHLAGTSSTLADVAQTHCTAQDPDLRAAYGAAFDAWVAVSHLRLGPTEDNNRAFALAFWPDSRGATPKTLATLIADQDPIIDSAGSFTEMSIAGRGFYAMEFLIYDPKISNMGDPAYHCALVGRVAADIAGLSQEIAQDWHNRYAGLLLSPGADGPYRDSAEARQILFKALVTGLEFTADTRMGRPMGSFDRPRAKRAEVWRSGRSLHHVEVSLRGLRDLAADLAAVDPPLAARIDAAFARSLTLAETLDDPVFAGVSTPQGRLKVEVVQQSITAIRTLASTELGPELGVAAGFNSLDGD
ncbi:MAG: putative lipoprotein [Sulfitobacter sp.]|jgi:predicted lipoprotein